MKDSSAPLCTYCENTATTRDHVPPKTMFGKPRPSDLITVPSCRLCNGGASLDDEYARLVTSFHHIGGDHPVAQKAAASALRSLQEPNKRKFSKAFISTIREIDQFSESGIYKGRRATFNADLDRVCNVVARTTRGLFYHHEKRRLPPSCSVKAYSLQDLWSRGPEQLNKAMEFIDHTNHAQMQSMADNAYCYRYSLVSDNINSSIWVHIIYEAISFFATTVESENSH